MEIKLLYFDGCPSHEKASELLDEVLRERNLDVGVEKVNVTSEEMAVDEKFLGSPSIKINGEDVDPVAKESTAYSRKCRIYKTDEGIIGWPTREMIASAIEAAA